MTIGKLCKIIKAAWHVFSVRFILLDICIYILQRQKIYKILQQSATRLSQHSLALLSDT
jgi:hypothetical protein